ncbi:MAG: iron hydrogenase [Parcubacteria group bacterium]|nr:MAG: iron hydrogenase [Parcubacteria group bacterium]
MALSKVISVEKKGILTVVQLAGLLGISVILPLFHQQWITGPMINAMLFIAVVLVGLSNAMILALLPSTIALSVGLLPPLLAPMIPFIMISNVVMVIAFDRLWQKDFWSGVVAGSVLKFLFLWSTSTLVINLVIKKELAPTISGMMSWPQLATALIGGAIAYGFLKSIKKI